MQSQLLRAQPSIKTLNQPERPSKYRLARSHASTLKELVHKSPKLAWEELFKLGWVDCDATPGPPESKEHNLLEIHGFVPLERQWDCTDVLICNDMWRTLPNLMRETYGQSLLADFFQVESSVMQQWIEEQGFPSRPERSELRLDINVSGQLRLVGYLSAAATTVPCLMATSTGRMLLQSDATGELMRTWAECSNAQDIIKAMAAARAPTAVRASRRGCFATFGSVIGLIPVQGQRETSQAFT